MRCTTAVHNYCFGGVAVVGLLSTMPQARTLSGTGRKDPLSIVPIPQISGISLAAQSFSPGRHHDVRDSFDLEHRSSLALPRSTQRSLASDLTASGLRFIFSQFDVIASSALAHHYTTQFYRNLTTVLTAERRTDPPPQTLVIAYGALKLTAAYVHDHGFTEDILAKVLLMFAEYMLDMIAMILIGAFQVAVLVMGDIRAQIGMDIQGIGD
ncbi:MAG: hypothetical protein Q9226_006192 [Calogaya cf. arnoldii]